MPTIIGAKHEKLAAAQAVINSNLMTMLESQQGREKTSEVAVETLKVKLREVSYGWQVLPPVQIDDDSPGLVYLTETDLPYLIRSLEPDATAAVVNFRGGVGTQYIRETRVALPFGGLATPLYQKDETELRASKSPLTKMVEEISMLELQRVIDVGFTESSREVTTRSGSIIPDTTSTALNTGVIQKMVAQMENNERRLAVLLMAKVLWSHVLAWTSEEAGGDWVSKKTQGGVSGSDILGYKIVTSIKKGAGLLKRNEIFGYTTPDYLGWSYVLENPKFYVNKDFRTIEFKAYMDHTMCFGNIFSANRTDLTLLDPETGFPLP